MCLRFRLCRRRPSFYVLDSLLQEVCICLSIANSVLRNCSNFRRNVNCHNKHKNSIGANMWAWFQWTSKKYLFEQEILPQPWEAFSCRWVLLLRLYFNLPSCCRRINIFNIFFLRLVWDWSWCELGGGWSCMQDFQEWITSWYHHLRALLPCQVGQGGARRSLSS